MTGKHANTDYRPDPARRLRDPAGPQPDAPTPRAHLRRADRGWPGREARGQGRRQLATRERLPGIGAGALARPGGGHRRSQVDGKRVVKDKMLSNVR